MAHKSNEFKITLGVFASQAGLRSLSTALPLVQNEFYRTSTGVSMKCLFLTALVVTMLVATVVLPGFGVQSEARPVDDPEAYVVYASLLPAEWTVRVSHAKTLVFQKETGTNWNCMPAGEPLKTEWKPVVENFRAENASVRLLHAGFPLGIPYVVVSATDIKASFSEVPNDRMGGWTGFYKRYPESGGITVYRPLVSIPSSSARWSTLRTRADCCAVVEHIICSRKSMVSGARLRFPAFRIAFGSRENRTANRERS